MEQRKTRNFVLALATTSDLPELEEIEKECDEYFKFDPPSAAEHNRSLGECLTVGDIIPGVSEEGYKRENYCIYCIRKDGVLAGWLAFYLGYQQEGTAYLSVLYVKEAYRKNGFGSEIIKALAHWLADANFKEVRLHCSLRNSTALCFWVKNGFDRIVRAECDGNLYPANFGSVELMKVLSKDKSQSLSKRGI